MKRTLLNQMALGVIASGCVLSGSGSLYGQQSRFLTRVAERATKDPETTRKFVEQGLKQLKVNPKMVYDYLDKVKAATPMIARYANQFVDNADQLFGKAVELGSQVDTFYEKLMPLIEEANAKEIIAALKSEASIKRLPAQVQEPARQAQRALNQVVKTIDSLNFGELSARLKSLTQMAGSGLRDAVKAVENTGALQSSFIPQQAMNQLKRLPNELNKLDGLFNKIAQVKGVSTEKTAELVLDTLIALAQTNPQALKTASQEIVKLVQKLEPYADQIKTFIQQAQAPANKLIVQAADLDGLVKLLVAELKDVTSLQDALNKVRGKVMDILNKVKPQLVFVLNSFDGSIDKIADFVGSAGEVQQIVDQLNLGVTIPASVQNELKNADKYAAEIKKLAAQVRRILGGRVQMPAAPKRVAAKPTPVAVKRPAVIAAPKATELTGESEVVLTIENKTNKAFVLSGIDGDKSISPNSTVKRVKFMLMPKGLERYKLLTLQVNGKQYELDFAEKGRGNQLILDVGLKGPSALVASDRFEHDLAGGISAAAGKYRGYQILVTINAVDAASQLTDVYIEVETASVQ